jgi:hypothetical protein
LIVLSRAFSVKHFCPIYAPFRRILSKMTQEPASLRRIIKKAQKVDFFQVRDSL